MFVALAIVCNLEATECQVTTNGTLYSSLDECYRVLENFEDAVNKSEYSMVVSSQCASWSSIAKDTKL